MKKILCLTLLAIMISACHSNGKDEKSITIKGTSDQALNGTKVYVLTLTAGRPEKMDSTVIANGSFEIKRQPNDSENQLYLQIGPAENHCFHRIFLDSQDITLNLQGEKGEEATVKGSPANDGYNAYYAEYLPIWKKYQELAVENPAEKEKLIPQLKALNIKHLKANIKNAFGIDLLAHFYASMELAEVEECMNLLSDEGKKNPIMQELAGWLKKQQEAGIGKPYTDFSLPNPEGKKLKLSQFVGKNKLVLVDFWASWCGPCRMEIPNVVRAYNRYKDKGFEVVGVSLDKDAKSWKEAISQLGMKWPQMSDLKYWDCAASKLYGIQSIPATILINEKGIIVARDLRGGELEMKLSELLDK